MNHSCNPLPPVLKSPLDTGRHMPRDRYQYGWVHKVGKRPRWYGEYYVYSKDGEGREHRKHKTVVLGTVQEMPLRSDALKKLRGIIDTELHKPPLRHESLTLRWFWEHRYWPLHRPKLKESSRATVKWIVENHLLKEFGDAPLAGIGRFELQTYLNRLATEEKSASFIHKARTYLKAILDEAIEQDFLLKNPARLLDKPRVVQNQKRFLTEKECFRLLQAAEGRDRLILRLFLLCGLRPGELFALRWDDVEPGLLRIDETVWYGRLDEPKTTQSKAYVALPRSLEEELDGWKQQGGSFGGSEFIFPSATGKPMSRSAWDRRHLKPIATAASLGDVTFQSLRRTFATLMQKCGTIKDAQTQLRHASAALTLGTYMQAIPDSVKEAVELLDGMISKQGVAGSRSVS